VPQPHRELGKRVGQDVVVGPQPAALGVDYAGVAQLLEVVAERRLGDIEQWDELVDADFAGVLAQNVDELQPGSQMAAALARRICEGKIAVRSAGSDPASHIDLTVVEAMAELKLDVAFEFPKPVTDEVLRAADVVVTMGCEDACPVVPGPRFAWTLEHTDQRSKDFMRELPFDLRFTIGDHKVHLVHGSPRKVNEYLFEDKPASLYERLAAAETDDVLVFGHTHKPWVGDFGGVRFVNCGSVGKPKDGDPRGAFTLLEAGTETVKVTIERVAYYADAVAAEVRAAGLPTEFADKLVLAA
jgi:protein-tyrosine-phosphatase